VTHHTAAVEAGERYIGVFAILHRAMDVIDAVNLGVAILKTQRPQQVFVIQRIKVSGSASSGEEIDHRRTVQRKFSVSVRYRMTRFTEHDVDFKPGAGRSEPDGVQTTQLNEHKLRRKLKYSSSSW
jgi:hypothetical protein